MPEYESPQRQREIEYQKRYEAEYGRDRYEKPKPNRRGDYRRAKMARVLEDPGSSWRRTREWRYQSRDIGQTRMKRWKRQRKAATRGFQHEFVPLEKPKIPGRVLRDAQEDQLWLDEIQMIPWKQ